MTPPEWFSRNIAVPADRTTIESDGCAIETLAWGKPGSPGLLFVHGNGAHADWWSPFAPFFSAERRVGAFSFSGMGRSGRRDRYSVEAYSREVVAVAEALALFDAAQKPWLVAHSMGAILAMRAMGAVGERFAGFISVDSGVTPPGAWAALLTRAPANAGFETLEDGLARFRLSPRQAGVEPWMLDHVARRSLVQHANGRWYWCFDPVVSDDLGIRHTPLPGYADYIRAAKCPLVFLFGDESSLITPAVRQHTRDIVPTGTRFIGMPAAHHHLMLDQPIAFVSAVRAILAS